MMNQVCIERAGRQVSVMKRTCLVANTSNFPVLAREASIYTGLTVAEYYRDMGYNVSLLVNSTSRWVEALKEISIMLGEIPTGILNHFQFQFSPTHFFIDAGYPSCLTSRLAQFYDRAGKVECNGSPSRQGSVTILGSVAPPLSSATLGPVQTFWALDKKLAQRKHFPCINWSNSFSNYDTTLEPYREQCGCGDLTTLCHQALDILHDGERIAPVVYSCGKESLPETAKVTLEVAKIIKSDFLQQNCFSDYDCTCPLYKAAWILRAIIRFHDLAQQAVQLEPEGKKLTFNGIKARMTLLTERITQMKFRRPQDGEETVVPFFQTILRDLEAAFQAFFDSI
eukprot:TRINITY_DN14417_c0_g1_i1.p1 TRINITY_DN14417_c0_g1~~TRINITY_DN14417_c0_g1_i1.p1  ORF type:complete len:340 (-),score=35.86 TRINITY_DN14417_c0_g1_i1:49-1068(-)